MVDPRGEPLPARRTETVPSEWFAALYDTDPDPWHFRDSAYERRKYGLTVASLPQLHYRRAFEPGCAFGELTQLLAPRCDAVLASDVVASVVERAAVALEPWPGVQVALRAIPDDWPDGPFDLVVLSEVGYYLDAGELAEVCDRILATLELGGHLLAVHWLGPTDYPLTGEEVHAAIDRSPGLEPLVVHREPEFELRCWQRT